MKVLNIRNLLGLVACLGIGAHVGANDVRDCDCENTCHSHDCDNDTKFDCAKEICVTSCEDSGCGSLRCAIDKANCKSKPVHIFFDLSKCDECFDRSRKVWCIQLESALPDIENCIFIDGYTQRKSRPNSNPLSRPNNAIIKIEVKGPSNDVNAAMNNGFDGFRFRPGSEGSRLSGLAIFGFFEKDTAAVRIMADDIEVSGNFFSTRADGKTLVPNTVDTMINSSNNMIGGSSVTQRNLFRGFGFDAFDDVKRAFVNAELFTRSLGAVTGRGQARGNRIWQNTFGVTA